MHKQNFAFFNENRKRNGELLEMELRMYRSTFSFNIIYIISLSLSTSHLRSSLLLIMLL
jgi:hypothetical protein